ncbi:MAG: hypothetical protein Q8L72_00650 [Moraxellaceae bacterium]|nr:hypothetical protein [Moraxellaceae bacterium]
MAQQFGTFKRSSVTKMLAAEVSRTTHDLPKGEEQYEAQTYLSPTGRVVAKIMIAGVATEKEDIGKDQSLWRLRVADPSGTIGVMASQFQPGAMQAIAQLEIPCYVAIVGKLNVYEPESGSHIVSIRPDSVTIITGPDRDNLVLDAALSTARSIKKTMADPEVMKRVDEAYRGGHDEEAYMLVAQQAIESLLPNRLSTDKRLTKNDDKTPPACDATAERCNDKAGEGKVTPPPASDKNQPKKKAEPPKTKEKPAGTKASPSSNKGKAGKEIDESIKTIQEIVLEVLKEKGEVVYTDLPYLLGNKGINPNQMDWESAVKRLMQEGLCYEPKLGRLKANV